MVGQAKGMVKKYGYEEEVRNARYLATVRNKKMIDGR